MDIISLQDKCYQYWPDQGCWTYGNVRVAVDDFTVLVDYTIRKFCVQYVSFDHWLLLLHIVCIHYKLWLFFSDSKYIQNYG